MEVFLNGRFQPASQATVSVQDRGLLYGDGLFETLRAANGQPFWLRQHLARLTRSAAALNLSLPEQLPWAEIIRELLRRNGLAMEIAIVKILVTRGEATTLGLPVTKQPTVIISARPYTPPPPEDYRHGWPVVVFPERRHCFLGTHKSLNYLFSLAARQYALDHGGREALILEADGNVAEGAAAGLLWQEQGSYCTPRAGNALPSVTLQVLREILDRRSLTIRQEPAPPARLLQAEGVWLANSLMGLMPVAALDGQPLTLAPVTSWLNDLLWSEAG